MQRDGVADDPFERRRAEQPCHELVERRVRVTILVELACGERGGDAVVSTRASSRVGVGRPRGDETLPVCSRWRMRRNQTQSACNHAPVCSR